MNSDLTDNMTGTGGMTGATGTTGGTGSTGSTGTLNGPNATANVQRVAQRAHEAVDTVAQSISSSTERMMDWQQEYGEMAREQIRANPIAVVAGAFALGWLFGKITR